MSTLRPGAFQPRHVVLYDGVCGLCNHLVRFLLHADRAEALGFASLQGAVGRRLLADHGVTPVLDTLYVLADYGSPGPRLLSRSDAVLFLAEAVGWRRTARLLSALPGAALDWCYDRVAATRYRLFDRYDACPLPAPEHRRRFMDT